MITKLKKALSLLLIAVMMIGLMPTLALASTDVQADGGLNRIVHLDCGRKYFSADWIKALITEIAAAGYDQLQLAFGNDGLRFLLDDMSFTANGTNYAHETVVSKVEAGNMVQNSSGDSRYLTEAEMDGIIAHAAANGIEIVPLLNLPGHANAILDIVDDAYNASGSNNTLDVANSDEAREFGTAIFKKYVDYFAAKGCSFFNFGADEYANDASGTFSFSRLNSTQYARFVSYINSLAAYIKEKGMTPRSFNDGLYYNNQTASIDTDIQCCYWSSGWGSYPVAAASTIAGKGHGMINTNGDYYYVLGKSDQFDSGYSYAANFSNTAFMGSTISDPKGAMFCIWCDYPNAETETEVAQKTRLVLRAMAKRMYGESIDSIATDVVPGGFNADGTINVVASNAMVSDAASGVSVTAPGVTALTVNKLAQAAYTECAAAVGYDITPYAGDSAYTGGGNVSITVPAELTSYAALSVYDAEKAQWLASTVSGGVISFTAEHFSEYDIVAFEAGAGNTVDVNLTVGETKTFDDVTAEAGDYITGSEKYLATAKVTTTNIPGTTVYTRVSSLAAGTYYVSTSANDSNPTTQLTLEKADDGYYLKNASGAYIYPNASMGFGWSYSLGTGKENVTVSSSGNGFTFSRNVSSSSGYFSTTAYLTLRNGTFGANGNSTTLYLYTSTTTEGSSKSSLTITGVGEGTKTVAIGDTTYNINVTASTVTDSKNLNYGESFTLPANAADAAITSGESIVTLSGNAVTAGNTAGLAVVTYVIKNAGGYVTAHYTVNIQVTEIDLSKVTGLTVEYWITNARVVADGAQSKTINASDPGVYGESGALFTDLVPATGTKSGSGEAMAFWKGTRLASDNKQTGNAGVDKTRAGTDFSYVRYFNGEWAYSADRVNWTAVASGDQIVAYYLQITDVTDEITTQVVDWGPQKSNWSELDYLQENYVLVDYSVKYESGTESPSSFPTSKTLAFHCKDTGLSNNGTTYRRIGMIRGVETSDYEVYMITLTPTADSPSTVLSGSVARYNYSYSYDGTEVVAWAKTQEDLDSSGLGTYTSISGAFTYSIGGEPIVSGLEIYKQHGLKVTYYVRAKVTEDSLTVHYIDRTANPDVEFYNYNIAVSEGTTFDAGFALVNGALVNNTVDNILGKTETVSADLGTMPSIGAQYRHSKYTCVEVARSEDGKDVYLYYTFDNTVSFVVDYGLAISIAPSDISSTLVVGSISKATALGAKYGTLTVNESTKAITYKPTKLLSGVDSFDVTYEGSKDGVTSTVSYKVYIYPATSVYYEDSFAAFENGEGSAYGAVWTDVGSANTTAVQALAVLGSDENVYGYDEAYDSCTEFSMGGAKKVTVTSAMANGWTAASAWPVASFTFTGTGFDVISLTDSNSGAIFVTVKEDGAEIKNLVVNNYYGYDYVNGEWVVDEDSTDTLYQVPVMKVSGLEYGEYTAEIRPAYYGLFDQTGDSEYSFWLDAVRVYDPAGPDNESYKADGEYKPSYQKIKSIIVDADTYNNGGGSINGAVFIDGMPEGATVETYKNYGPNNETYLANGQAVAFKLIATEKPQEVQLGVKLALGESAQLVGSLGKTLTTATDMYYSLNGLTWTQQDGKYVSSVITVGNNTDGSIVSLTNVKITGGAAFTTLSAVRAAGNEALAAAFVDAATLDEAVALLSEEPAQPELPEIPEQPVFPEPDAGLDPVERPEGGSVWENPYNDVDENEWYFEFIKAVTESGLMNGVGEGFDPNGRLTRAMLVTVLYRMSGSDPVEPTHKFEDVVSGWYADGVAWGYANGIIVGYSDVQFAPDSYVSRQEMAAMIARYAKLVGLELPTEFSVLFSDDTDIADYAREAVYALREKGIINGRDGNVFDPRGTATRAETAKVIAMLSAF